MSQSFGSQGFSLKAPGAATDDSTSIKYETFEDESEKGVFGTKCHQSSSCGPIKCYSFKSNNDCLFCCSVFLMIVALFIGVIGPLVSFEFLLCISLHSWYFILTFLIHLQVINSIIDETINSQVVIDSASSPSFNVWQTNAEGEGTKVSMSRPLF